MNKIKNSILSAVAFVAAGFGFSSCDIDLLPLNEVVYENFWTNKEDVESVVAACYASMQESDYMANLIVWGEGRSDNVDIGPSIPEDLRYLMQGSVKTTNKYCNWSSLYKAINHCNVVLVEAPKVARKDPNYTDSELRINIGECRFIRAYSYFTLIKSFKNVPFTFEASIDDNQPYRLPQTDFEVILDTLIQDIEACKNFPPNRYEDQEKNTGRVTRVAMYSLLSEMYLWRAADYRLTPAQQNEYYKRCVECADWVINYKNTQYEENNIDRLDLRAVVDKYVYTTYGYPLLAEEVVQGSNTDGPRATNSIFGEGGSYETIFELTFNFRGQTKSNGTVTDMYGRDANTYNMCAHEKVFESKPGNDDSYKDTRLFPVPSDYRSIASFYYDESGGSTNILKYVIDDNRAGAQGGDYGRVGSAYTAPKRSQTYRSTPANWILYRLSEIMLIRAEAEIEMAFNLKTIAAEAEKEAQNQQNADDNQDEGDDSNGEAPGKLRKAPAAYVPGSSLTTPEELLNDAYQIIMAVYVRSNPYVQKQSKYAPTQPKEQKDYRKLLMDERRREFLFEGKRYYDLVRMARRAGNTREFRNALTLKYGAGGAAVAIKMIQMDFMYLPVARSEMKVNPALKQNSSYLDELENIKN